MEQVCLRCGERCDEPGARFCPQCGGRLEARPSDALPPPLASLQPEPVPATAVPSRLPAEHAGARCAAHPQVPASDLCSRCGNFACQACVKLDAEGRPLCASCAERVSLGRWDIPWERRKQLGLFQGYWQTAKAAAFEPQKSFGSMEVTGTWWDAMSYAMVSYALSISGTFLVYLIGFGAIGVVGALSTEKFAKDLSAPVVVAVVVGIILFIAVSIPAGALMRVYLFAGLDHLMLLLLGGGKGGFDATFRGYCYGMSPAMFGLLPGCGVYIWEIWRMVCQVLAYKRLHQMPGARAAAAVVSPVVLCCGGYFVLVFGVQLLGAASH